MSRSPFRRSCAFFDVDGTLLRGFIIQSFPRFLADEGIIEAAYPDKIDAMIADYGSGKISYREAAETVPSLYALALKGRRTSDVKTWARRFIDVYLPEHIYSYSKQLVRYVSNLVDVTVAISGSPLVVVAELEGLGFNRVYGSLFEEKDGVYTGKVILNLILGEKKAAFARKICEEMDVEPSRSVAFGDTDQDEPLLSMVGLPVAVNPNRKLREICIQKGGRCLDGEDLKDLEKVIEWLKHEIESLKTEF